MRIIPVLDLKGGQAVHAVAGDRAHYRPVRSVLHPGPDALGLARAYRERLGVTELYLADLDAIGGGRPACEAYEAIAGLGTRLWIDAGIRGGRDLDARPGQGGPLPAGDGHVLIVGLETIAGPAALREVGERVGAQRLAFSLDLRAGRPLVATGAAWGTADPLRIAGWAVGLGILRLVVLDLARVGTGRGLGTLGLLRALRRDHPAVELVAGGGISGPAELDELAEVAAAALVGSALHDGRLDADHLVRYAAGHDRGG